MGQWGKARVEVATKAAFTDSIEGWPPKEWPKRV